ncbi:MAG TPA: transferrin receptor-like dimerization domain-containing protein, partial [Pyrinomonadaceae bacterium]
PKTGKSIYQQWQDRARELRPDGDTTDTSAATNIQRTTAQIGALGSGSDYTPFLQHLGIPSTDMGFGGDYGVYHSAFDSFYWMTHFGDPDFVYHVAAAQLWGTLAMRLAEAPSLPLNYSDYAAQILQFVNDDFKLAVRRSLSGFDEKAALEAIDRLASEAARAEKTRQDTLNQFEHSEASSGTERVQLETRLRHINDLLMAVERSLTDQTGLHGRPWYKHQIYAPGLYTGYAALPLPDFRQALDDRNTTNAQEGLTRIVQAVQRASETLRKVSE